MPHIQLRDTSSWEYGVSTCRLWCEAPEGSNAVCWIGEPVKTVRYSLSEFDNFRMVEESRIITYMSDLLIH